MRQIRSYPLCSSWNNNHGGAGNGSFTNNQWYHNANGQDSSQDQHSSRPYGSHNAPFPNQGYNPNGSGNSFGSGFASAPYQGKAVTNSNGFVGGQAPSFQGNQIFGGQAPTHASAQGGQAFGANAPFPNQANPHQNSQPNWNSNAYAWRASAQAEGQDHGQPHTQNGFQGGNSPMGNGNASQPHNGYQQPNSPYASSGYPNEVSSQAHPQQAQNPYQGGNAQQGGLNANANASANHVASANANANALANGGATSHQQQMMKNGVAYGKWQDISSQNSAMSHSNTISYGNFEANPRQGINQDGGPNQGPYQSPWGNPNPEISSPNGVNGSNGQAFTQNANDQMNHGQNSFGSSQNSSYDPSKPITFTQMKGHDVDHTKTMPSVESVARDRMFDMEDTSGNSVNLNDSTAGLDSFMPQATKHLEDLLPQRRAYNLDGTPGGLVERKDLFKIKNPPTAKNPNANVYGREAQSQAPVRNSRYNQAVNQSPYANGNMTTAMTSGNQGPAVNQNPYANGNATTAMTSGNQGPAVNQNPYGNSLAMPAMNSGNQAPAFNQNPYGAGHAMAATSSGSKAQADAKGLPSANAPYSVVNPSVSNGNNAVVSSGSVTSFSTNAGASNSDKSFNERIELMPWDDGALPADPEHLFKEEYDAKIKLYDDAYLKDFKTLKPKKKDETTLAHMIDEVNASRSNGASLDVNKADTEGASAQSSSSAGASNEGASSGGASGSSGASSDNASPKVITAPSGSQFTVTETVPENKSRHKFSLKELTSRLPWEEGALPENPSHLFDSEYDEKIALYNDDALPNLVEFTEVSPEPSSASDKSAPSSKSAASSKDDTAGNDASSSSGSGSAADIDTSDLAPEIVAALAQTSPSIRRESFATERIVESFGGKLIDAKSSSVSTTVSSVELEHSLSSVINNNIADNNSADSSGDDDFGNGSSNYHGADDLSDDDSDFDKLMDAESDDDGIGSYNEDAAAKSGYEPDDSGIDSDGFGISYHDSTCDDGNEAQDAADSFGGDGTPVASDSDESVVNSTNASSAKVLDGGNASAPETKSYSVDTASGNDMENTDKVAADSDTATNETTSDKAVSANASSSTDAKDVENVVKELLGADVDKSKEKSPADTPVFDDDLSGELFGGQINIKGLANQRLRFPPHRSIGRFQSYNDMQYCYTPIDENSIPRDVYEASKSYLNDLEDVLDDIEYKTYISYMEDRELQPLKYDELLEVYTRLVLGDDGVFAKKLKGYKKRKGQIQFASHVCRTLSDFTVLIEEAGTGTGKTFAYLIPAILSGKQIVVSTGTKALQDQLVQSDINTVVDITDKHSCTHLGLKGMSNYICRYLYDGTATNTLSETGLQPYTEIVEKDADEMQNDAHHCDFGELKRVSVPEHVSLLTCDSFRCSEMRGSCPYAKSKAQHQEKEKELNGEDRPSSTSMPDVYFEILQAAVNNRCYKGNPFLLNPPGVVRPSDAVPKSNENEEEQQPKPETVEELVQYVRKDRAIPELDDSQCFVYGVRRTSQESNVVVINHAVLFGAFVSKSGFGGSNSTVPLPDILVFDEAHTLADRGRSFLAESFSREHLYEIGFSIIKVCYKENRRPFYDRNFGITISRYFTILDSLSMGFGLLEDGEYQFAEFKYQHTVNKSIFELLGKHICADLYTMREHLKKNFPSYPIFESDEFDALISPNGNKSLSSQLESGEQIELLDGEENKKEAVKSKALLLHKFVKTSQSGLNLAINERCQDFYELLKKVLKDEDDELNRTMKHREFLSFYAQRDTEPVNRYVRSYNKTYRYNQQKFFNKEKPDIIAVPPRNIPQNQWEMNEHWEDRSFWPSPAQEGVFRGLFKELMLTVSEMLTFISGLSEGEKGDLERVTKDLQKLHAFLPTCFNADINAFNVPTYTLTSWISVAPIEDDDHPSFTINLSPIEISEIFSSHMRRLLALGTKIIFTSATMKINDRFNSIIEKLGFSCDEVLTATAASPFDYEKNSLLMTSSQFPDVKDAHRLSKAIDQIKPAIEACKGGIFFLTTSHRAKDEAFDILNDLYGHKRTVLKQGDRSNNELIRAFKDLGNAILVGTSSFWEGVDVSGDALSLVIIDKLPFKGFTDPLAVARQERCRERLFIEDRLIELVTRDWPKKPAHDPFEQISVPEMIMTLRQGVGRLIRSETDQGCVILLDPRVDSSKNYAQGVKISMPPMRRVHNIEDVVDFLKNMTPKTKS